MPRRDGGMTIGIAIWAYTLMLPSFAGRRHRRDHNPEMKAPGASPGLRPQALIGLDLPRWCTALVWSLAFNVLAYVTFSVHPPSASIERLQADRSCPRARPMTPASGSWRSAVTVDELTSTVAHLSQHRRARERERH